MPALFASCRVVLRQCLNATDSRARLRRHLICRHFHTRRQRPKRCAVLPKGAERKGQRQSPPRQLRSQPSSSARAIGETCSAYSGNLHQKREFLTKPSQGTFPRYDEFSSQDVFMASLLEGGRAGWCTLPSSFSDLLQPEEPRRRL